VFFASVFCSEWKLKIEKKYHIGIEVFWISVQTSAGFCDQKKQWRRVFNFFHAIAPFTQTQNQKYVPNKQEVSSEKLKKLRSKEI
jgi:hypothetical protein